MCQAFAPLLIRAGGGSIVNFSTIAVALGLQGESAYAASKAGVETFSRTLARELAGHGITVNCVAPGPIATDLLKGVSQDQIDRITDRQIIQRQFTTADVCDVVEVLLDSRSKSLTGQVLHVGGV
jgi:3-oxoacyl-[acyl-carrier protein] reductase